MKRLLFVLSPLLLCAQVPDRVSDLVEAMRSLTFAGDHTAASRIMPVLIRELATPHPKAGLAWNQIGVHHTMAGNFAEAERAYRRGIRLLEHSGANDGDLALLLLNLGELQLRGGRSGQAESLLRRAHALAVKASGPDAPELANYIYVLGAARMERGDRIDARKHFERALAMTPANKEGRISRGIILGNLAVLFARDKQWNRARETMLEAVSLLERNLASDHSDLIPPYMTLAELHARFKDWELATASIEKARRIVVTRHGTDHPYMPAILNAQAEILKSLGHRSEAAELRRQAKAISASQPRDGTGDSWVHISDLKN